MTAALGESRKRFGLTRSCNISSVNVLTILFIVSVELITTFEGQETSIIKLGSFVNHVKFL